MSDLAAKEAVKLANKVSPVQAELTRSPCPKPLVRDPVSTAARVRHMVRVTS